MKFSERIRESIVYFVSVGADSTLPMILNGLLSEFLELLNGSIIAMVDISFLLSFQITFKGKKCFIPGVSMSLLLMYSGVRSVVSSQCSVVRHCF